MSPVDSRNLFAAIPEAVPGQAEFVERLAGANGARVERIVSRGHASPPGFWYDQAETEWVLLVAGRARLRFDPERVLELGPGDHVVIAPHTRHRVEWTDPAVATVWIAVFLPAEPA